MPKRIVIAGGPNTGKTTLALELARQHGINSVRNTDQLIGLGWSEASAKAAEWMDDPGDWIIEGVVTPRALRKWMDRHAGEQLPDGIRIHVLTQPHTPQSKNQQTMTKGMFTVLQGIYGELVRRGATFEPTQPRGE
jgi:dephospho-CoA kinase